VSARFSGDSSSVTSETSMPAAAETSVTGGAPSSAGRTGSAPRSSHLRFRFPLLTIARADVMLTS